VRCPSIHDTEQSPHASPWSDPGRRKATWDAVLSAVRLYVVSDPWRRVERASGDLFAELRHARRVHSISANFQNGCVPRHLDNIARRARWLAVSGGRLVVRLSERHGQRIMAVFGFGHDHLWRRCRACVARCDSLADLAAQRHRERVTGSGSVAMLTRARLAVESGAKNTAPGDGQNIRAAHVLGAPGQIMITSSADVISARIQVANCRPIHGQKVSPKNPIAVAEQSRFQSGRQRQSTSGT